MTILTAKTRVVAIKSLCVARLKLCTALLGTNEVKALVSAPYNRRFRKPKLPGYTKLPSTLTLAWLQKISRKWNSFVANRIAKFQNINPASYCKFVPTEENPADCASRRISASNLTTPSLCWYGPQLLKKTVDL